MKYLHGDFNTDKWFAMPVVEQLANIGTEIGRAIDSRKTDASRGQAAF